MSGFENWHELARANGIAAREVAMMAESIEPRVQAIAAALTAY
jgi:hypothetical protein